MRSISTGLALSLTILILSCILPVAAVPPLPAEYYGNVQIDGSPAPVGTIVTAIFQNVSRGTLTTEITGFYGGPGLFDPRLKVNISEKELQSGNLLITFQINGIQASESILFEPGTSQQFDISTGSGNMQVTGPGSTPVPVQILPPTSNPVENTTEPFFELLPADNNSMTPQENQADSGPSIRYGLESDEKFTSDDSIASVDFKRDTLMFAPSGQFLENITISPRNITNLPPIDPNLTLIYTGYAYEITPERTYFNPEGTLSFHIPIEKISDLYALNPQIFEYNPQIASWNQLKTSSNQFTGGINGTIYEAAVYALFIESQSENATSTTGANTQMPATLAPIAGGQASIAAFQQYPQQSIPSQPPEDVPQVQPQAYESNTNHTVMPTSIQTPASEKVPEQVNITSTTPEITQVITEVPVETLHPATPAFPDFLSPVKKSLAGPVGMVTTIIILIIFVNVIAYLVYTRWWLGRSP